MPKLRFTTDTIKRLKPPIDKSKVQYFDSELTGFMLEVKTQELKPTTTDIELTLLKDDTHRHNHRTKLPTSQREVP